MEAGRSSIATDAATPPTAEAEESDPPHPARLELALLRVAKRFGDDPGRIQIADLGRRVLVTSQTPVAWAEGKGSLARDPILERGLDPGPPGMWSGAHREVQSIGGTFPDAVYLVYGFLPEARGVQYDLPLHHLGEGGWKLDRALGDGILPTSLSPYGPRSVLVAAFQTGDDNALPAGWDPPSPTWIIAGDAPKPVRLKLATEIAGGTTVATRDGHVFVLGTKRQGPGVWLAHVAPDGGPTTHHTVPGTEGCSPRKMREHVFSVSLHASEGGRAVVAVSATNEACPRMKAGIYEEGAKGLVRSAIVAPGSAPASGNTTQVLGIGADGTLWLTNLEPGGLWRARPLAAGDAGAGAGSPEPVAMPSLVAKKTAKGPLDVKLSFDPPPNDKIRPCEPRRVVSRTVDGEEDLWVIAHCDGERNDYEVVLRFGRPQVPIVVGPPPDAGAP